MLVATVLAMTAAMTFASPEALASEGPPTCWQSLHHEWPRESENIFRELIQLLDQRTSPASPWSPLISAEMLRQTRLRLDHQYGKELSRALIAEAQSRLQQGLSLEAEREVAERAPSPRRTSRNLQILRPESVYVFQNVTAGKFSPDQKKILLLSLPESLKLVQWPLPSPTWANPSPQKSRPMATPKEFEFAKTFAKESAVFASGAVTPLRNLPAVKAGEVVIHFYEFNRRILRTLDLSADGQKLVAASGDLVHLWDTQSGRFLSELRPKAGVVASLKYSQSKDWLAVGTSQHETQLWNLQEKRKLFSFAEADQDVIAIDFSPDGHQLATVSAQGHAKIWNTDDGTLITELNDPSSTIRDLVYNHSGRMIITVSGDGFIRFFDTRTGHLLLSQPGLAEKLKTVAISPDDQWLLVGSDGLRPATRLWHLYSDTTLEP
jgi:WD40 repeat protein